jgi:hypothetical protein
MRKVLLVLVALVAFMGVSAATGIANDAPGGSPPGCSPTPGNMCDDNGGQGCDKSSYGGECTPPPQCDKSGHGGDCKPPDGGKPPHEGECPPAEGPISGIVQSVSDGVREAGLGPVADLIDVINCKLIVDVLHLSAAGTGL